MHKLGFVQCLLDEFLIRCESENLSSATILWYRERSLRDRVRIQDELSPLFGHKMDLVSKRELAGLIRDEILASRQVIFYVLS